MKQRQHSLSQTPGNATDKIKIIDRDEGHVYPDSDAGTDRDMVFIVRVLVHEMCLTMGCNLLLQEFVYPRIQARIAAWMGHCYIAPKHTRPQPIKHKPVTGEMTTHLAPGPAGRTTAPHPP